MPDPTPTCAYCGLSLREGEERRGNSERIGHPRWTACIDRLREENAALREALVYAADAPMVETLRLSGASEDAIHNAIVNHLGSMPSHYSETLESARALTKEKADGA